MQVPCTRPGSPKSVRPRDFAGSPRGLTLRQGRSQTRRISSQNTTRYISMCVYGNINKHTSTDVPRQSR